MVAMLAAGIYAALVALFTVSLLRALRDRQTFGLRPAKGDDVEFPSLTVIVPARDEEANVVDCLLSLLEQDYPAGLLEVILVDDGSTDGTRQLAEALAREHPNLRVTGAPALPAGWTGKNHACHQGAEEARGEWLCFVDADTRAEPALLATTVRHARDERADLLSLNPFQRIETPGERLLLPAVFLSIAASMDFRAVNDPASSASIANGQFMLFRRAAYEELGGHEAVRCVVMEDLALARRVKEAGLRLRWAFGDALMSTRMYASVGAVWSGFSKNLSEILGLDSAPRALASALRALLLGWLGPLLLLYLARVSASAPGTPGTRALWIAGLALGTLAAIVLTTLRELRVPLAYGLAAPLGFAFHAALVLASWRRRRTGRRRWKGREYT